MDYYFSTKSLNPDREPETIPVREAERILMQSPLAVPLKTREGGVFMYGFDLGWYVVQVRRPLAYGVMLAVVVTMLAMWLPTLWGDGADVLTFIVKIAVWAGIGWRVIRYAAGSVGAAAMAAGMAGLVIGFALALLRLAAVREVWTLFNLIIEPVVSGIFGFGIGGASALAAKPFRRPVHTAIS